ncbi:MAG: SprT-like domain-containing protein [Lachnospiraceae bacterium]|nr:SprT-like domain-containing protein [Lachnospiraceae bacterium]
MQNLNELVSIAVADMEDLGYTINKNNSYVVNYRAKNRWGLCKHNPDGTCTIEISHRLLNEGVSRDAIMNTLMHELIHTLPGCNNHGVNFKRVAQVINDAYGLNIKRATSAEEKGIEVPIAPAPVYKYKFRCRACGQIISRTRESKFTKNYDRYSCGYCGGRFEKIF